MTNAASRWKSSCAISDGLSSSATSTSGPSTSRNRSSGSPSAAQVHAQAADDVGDVPLALAQVGIVDLVEERRHFVERALQRRLGVQPLVADDRGGAIDQHRIVEHQQLRVEQIGVLGAGGGGDALLDVLDLHARLRARGVEPRQLVADAALGNAEAQVGACRA